jgi:hypothetical protein
MSHHHHYDYSRKSGGFHADSKRDFRRIMTMLIVGGVIIAFLIHFILVK